MALKQPRKLTNLPSQEVIARTFTIHLRHVTHLGNPRGNWFDSFPPEETGLAFEWAAYEAMQQNCEIAVVDATTNSLLGRFYPQR